MGSRDDTIRRWWYGLIKRIMIPGRVASLVCRMTHLNVLHTTVSRQLVDVGLATVHDNVHHFELFVFELDPMRSMEFHTLKRAEKAGNRARVVGKHEIIRDEDGAVGARKWRKKANRQRKRPIRLTADSADWKCAPFFKKDVSLKLALNLFSRSE
jgi:hypothetical protein